jgi:hypothetical protein
MRIIYTIAIILGLMLANVSPLKVHDTGIAVGVTTKAIPPLKPIKHEIPAPMVPMQVVAVETPKPAVEAPVASAVVAGCGDNQYAQFIYQHESGCNLNAVNGGGCRGIGQACPGNKLPCGADYACQNQFFSSYAIGRYGSWEAAYAFWVSNRWW